MTPEQALKMLDGLIAKVQLTREGHEQVQRAVSILREAIKPTKDTS